MIFTKKWLLPVVIITAFTVTACGKKDPTDASKSETQVVAKVNKDEISIHQINFQLNRLTQNSQKPLNEAQSKDAARQILTRLVDQQLLQQQAIEAKLDRDPRILQVIEASKNEILAQAYLEQMLSKAAKPTTAEIDNFYQENPALFENRRVFRLQELAVNVSADKYAEIEENVKRVKNINEVAAWLKSQNYPFNANSNVRAAEQLPLDFLTQIQTLKDGELIVTKTPQSISVVHIAASQSAPIARDKATPIIEQYFLNQNKSALAKKEMAALKEKANIEYVGAFADMKTTGDTKSESQVTSKAIKKSEPNIADTASHVNDTATNATADSKPNDSTVTLPMKAKPDSNQSNIDKGLAGF